MDKIEKATEINSLIYELRGQKVMLDSDISQLYGISTKALNQAVKRNFSRFPADFMFQLTHEEAENLMSQSVTSSSRSQNATTNSRSQSVTLKDDNLKSQNATSRWGGVRKLPYAFTRNGVNMLAAVLRSQTAIDRSIFIMRAFSTLEEAIGRRKNPVLSSPKVVSELSVHSRAIMRLFQEGKVKDARISKVEELQKEISRLIQKIIVASLE
jgi:hypothetical protein